MGPITDLPLPAVLVLRYFWLLGIAAALGSAAFGRMTARAYIERDASLKEGYDRLIRGAAVYLSAPWIVMGIGMIFGKFNTIFDLLLSLKNWDPFSVVFFGVVIADALFLFIWVWFVDGAEFLAAHPGVFSLPRSTALIKIMAAAGVAASMLLAYAIVGIYPGS